MTNPLEHCERLFRTGDTNYDKKVMRCPDCDEPLNDLWVCEFCQVDYEPSQELKNKVIRQFLENKGKESPHQTKHTAIDYIPNDDTITDKLKTKTFYLPETLQEAIKRWKKELEGED